MRPKLWTATKSNLMGTKNFPDVNWGKDGELMSIGLRDVGVY